MVTRWWSTFKLVERVIKLEAPLKLMFQDEFRHRTSANQPTLLEAFELTDDDFDGLRAILNVSNPLSLAQKALEGDQYVNISLVPLAVGACQVIADPETEADLSILIDKMLEDFNSRWRDACYCMPITTHRARNHQVGISTYHF